MASKNELVSEIRELADQLGLQGIQTRGKSHDELTDLLSDLKAKQRDAELQTDADRAVPAGLAPQAPRPDGYVIAPGKSITSRRGVRTEGDCVEPKDFKGGRGTFDLLRSKGYITEG